MGLFIWWCSGTTQLLLSVALVRPWLVTKPGTRNQISFIFAKKNLTYYSYLIIFQYFVALLRYSANK